MIEMDVMVGDISKFVGIEVELRGIDAFTKPL